jgi:hypothetical protein
VTTLRVVLADAPTDVLVHLVDHGPCSRGEVERAVAPAGVAGTVATVAAALSLLTEMGWAEVTVPVERPGPYLWSATAEGREAVARARAAAS